MSVCRLGDAWFGCEPVGRLCRHVRCDLLVQYDKHN